jgi:hypothetical protein
MITLTVLCPRDECGAEIEVECEVEPGEMYGQDADGNRGMWVPAAVLPNIPPTECPECKATFTLEQFTALEKKLEELAAAYEFDSGYEDD